MKALLILVLLVSGCGKKENVSETPSIGGMASIQDSGTQKNIVSIAASSKDHTTLVAAVKAAGLLDSLANPGPFTVFAPTNAAFEKLPKGTVESLLEPSKKNDLVHILEYHVAVGTYKKEYLTDGLSLGMANGKNIQIKVQNGEPILNGNAKILASIPASNGIIHVIDSVLLEGK